MTQTTEQTVFGVKESARYAGLSYHSFRQVVKAGAIRPLDGTKKFRKTDLDRLVGRNEGGEHADAKTTE